MRVFLFLAFLFFSTPVYAALPAQQYDGSFNNEIAQVVQANAVKRGFAANDPRVLGTYKALSSKIATIATTAGTGLSLSASPWLRVIGMTLAAVGGVYTIYEGMQWLFNNDGTVTVSGSQESTQPVDTAPTAANYGTLPADSGALSAAYYDTLHLATGNCVYQGDDNQFLQCIYAALAVGEFYSFSTSLGGVNTAEVVSVAPVLVSSVSTISGAGKSFRTFVITLKTRTYLCGSSCDKATMQLNSNDDHVQTPRFSVSWSSACPGGAVLANGVCTVAATAPSTQSLDGALSSLPASAASKPLNSGVIAAFVNTVWKDTASTTDAFLPFDPKAPITASDVDQVSSATGVVPKVSTVAEPVSSVSTGVSIPETQTVTTSPSTPVVPASTVAPQTVPNSSAPTVNLGTDPNIGFPTLEDVPTSYQILSPILGLFSGLKTWVVPSHSSVCPVGSFSLFSKTFVLDQHCVILEQVRSVLSSAMMVCYALLALFKVLSA